MAYINTTNVKPGATGRTALRREYTHSIFSEHIFDTQITNVAQSLKAIIQAQLDGNGKPVKVLATRSHIEITNTDAAATLYIGRSPNVSSSNYQFKLSASGGYLKEPCAGDNDLYVISSAATQAAMVTEVG